MTENLESSSTLGSTGAPSSDVSQGQNVQPPSTFDASKLPEQLESLVSKAVEKAVQSQKDRRFSEIEKTLGDFKPVLERVKGLLTPEQLAQFNQIQRDAEIDELKQTVQKLTQTGAPAVGNQQSTAANDAQRILQAAQLDANTPEVLDLIRQYGNDPVTLAVRAGELRAKAANKPSPSAAESASILTESAPPSGDLDSMISKLNEMQKFPTKNRAEITRLTTELDKRGWK
jgi:hypothetical protein